MYLALIWQLLTLYLLCAIAYEIVNMSLKVVGLIVLDRVSVFMVIF